MKKIKTTVKKVLIKIYEPVINGIVMAVLASILATAAIDHLNKSSEIKRQLEDISNLYIGCSMDWADEHFGVPQFTSKKGNYTLCAYISDFSVIQIAFDENESNRAYLITKLNKKNREIIIDDATLHNTDKIELGKVSYYNLPGSPKYVDGWVTQGIARALYAEVYYYAATGGYYDYCFASLDFGELNGNVEYFLSQFKMPEQQTIDDEVDISKNKGVQIITDRKNAFPNTYGVAASTEALDDLLSYDWFNSTQLRNRYSVFDITHNNANK